MFEESAAQLESQVAQIKHTKVLSGTEKRKRIDTLRNSQVGGTDSSAKVVSSIANTMIGSAIIVYPILFVKDGLIGSVLIMLAVGCCQFLTCRLLVIHNRKSESDFGASIRRICGENVFKTNSLVNTLVLFFVCIAYFLLVVQNFFQVSAAIISSFKDYVPPKTNTINFEVYSIQWATIIAALFCAPLLFWKSIDGLLKVFKFTFYLVVAYGIFILISLIRQIVHGNIVFSKFTLFVPNFSNVAGAFALSFLIHPTAAPILKKNKRQDNNQRDLLLGYCLTAFIYFYVGFIGGLTCANEVQNILEHPNEFSTIFDCVNTKNTTQETVFYVIGKVVQFGILLQNVSVFPILNFLARGDFVKLVNSKKYENAVFYGETILLIVAASLVSILCIDVSIILSVDGAIIGFVMGYAIPILMHLTCYHKKLNPQQRQMRVSLLSSTQSGLVAETARDIEGMDPDSKIQFQDEPVDEQQMDSMLRCNPHPVREKTKHYILYGGLALVGVSLGIFKLYSFFQ